MIPLLAICSEPLLSSARASADPPAPRLLPPFTAPFAAHNTSALRARASPLSAGSGSTWAIASSCCGYGPFTEANVTRASELLERRVEQDVLELKTPPRS